MLNRRELLIGSGLALLPLLALASKSSDNAAAQRMRAFIESTPYARGRFSQSTLDRDGKPVSADSQGNFRFLRPGCFEWSIDKPYVQRIFSNGYTLWIYDPDLAQVTVRQITGSDAISQSPAGLLFGTTELDSIAELKLLDADTVFAKFFNPSGNFESASVHFKGNELEELTLKSSLGQTVRVRFLEFTRQVQQAESFNFTPPAGTDILKM